MSIRAHAADGDEQSPGGNRARVLAQVGDVGIELGRREPPGGDPTQAEVGQQLGEAHVRKILSAARISLVKFDWGSRTYVMGVINVTPDSFSGDGLGDDADGAVALAVRMAEDGADLIDVGGMSSRPGHQEIPDQEELRRVMSVLPRIAATVQVPVSVDSYRYQVAEAAVQ